MKNFDTVLNEIFAKLDHNIKVAFPNILAETAVEEFKDSFVRKEFDGKKWQKYKGKKEPRKGSLMLRTGNLQSTIKPSLVSAQTVRISAGSAKVPYARIHNEGGEVQHAARSETFTRNYKTLESGMRRFTPGTSPGKGFTFKSYNTSIPQRQFMGKSASLLRRLDERFRSHFNANK